MQSPNPDNAQLAQTTEAITEMQTQPRFLNYLINFLFSNDNPGAQFLTLTFIKNNIKQFWENDALYENKAEIRSALLKLLVMSSVNFVPIISESISLVAQKDFPERWPDMMQVMTNYMENNEPQIVYAVIYAAKTFFSKFDFQMESASLMNQINEATRYWDRAALSLLTEVLPQYSIASEEVEMCYYNVLCIIYSLSSHCLSPYLYSKFDVLFEIYIRLLNLEQGKFNKIKCQVCSNVRQCLIRYMYEIHHWGDTEENKKEPQEIENFFGIWSNLLKSVLGAVQGADDLLIVAVFDALKQLARTTDRNFFIEQEILLSLCRNVLIPCIQLNEQDMEDFQYEPFQYFNRDIDGIDGSKRAVAYDFLKVLCKYFRAELGDVFTSYSRDLLQSFQSNPENNWVAMDTAIFIMGALAAEQTFFKRGVTKVCEGFELDAFINSFILPQLSTENSFYVLQVDALKFLVDFRNVIIQIIPDVFACATGLLESQSTVVKLYALYCIENILDLIKYQKIEYKELFPKVNMQNMIKKVISLFVIDSSYNVHAVSCLTKIVEFGHEYVQPYLKSIINTCTNYILRISENNKDSNFIHYIFEIMAAAATKTQINIVSIEMPVLELINQIISNNVSDYIPYAFQLIGTYLLSYPEGSEINTFYPQQFPFFLNSELWQPQGNIPALVSVIRAYSIKLPELVIENMNQILEITTFLLNMPRAHVHAFTIYEIFFHFFAPNISEVILQQVLPLVSSQVTNQELVLYRQSFALFLANAACNLGADTLIQYLNPLDEYISMWGETILPIRGRPHQDNILSGVLKVLLESTKLNESQWTILFCSLLQMFESPSDKFFEDMSRQFRQEEKDAMIFDTTFSKLVNSEIDGLNVFPSLKDTNLIEYMAQHLASYNQMNPGVIARAAEHLPPNIQRSLKNYEQRYQVNLIQ